MTDFISAGVLGLVEGLTEFLPVSSTGHLILAGHLLNLPSSDFWSSFEIAIQLGAIAAVVALYWRKLFLSKRMFLLVTVGFIPTAVLGFLLYPFVKHYLLGSTSVVLWALLLGGLALIVFEYLRRRKQVSVDSGSTEITFRQALAIGFFQVLALVPGVSRSAATIVGGLLLGISRASVVEFSFLLAVPTMVAATGYDLLKTAPTFSSHEAWVLAVGAIVAFVSAFLAVRFFISFVQKHTFTPFGVYRVVLALAFLMFL